MLAKGIATMLEIGSLASGYGKKQVLDSVSLTIDSGEIVAVIGHNGAGKSTLLKAVFGMLPIWSGSLRYNGQSIKAPRPRKMIRAGVSYMPQGNRVFGDLTVAENLQVAGAILPNHDEVRNGVERALCEYPALKTRLSQRAGTLSGGEKQMLALAASLVHLPVMMLLDEPSLGLASALATDALGRIHRLSRERGITILIVEQKVREVLKIADRVYVLRNGRVSYGGSAESLRDERKLREEYL